MWGKVFRRLAGNPTLPVEILAGEHIKLRVAGDLVFRVQEFEPMGYPPATGLDHTDT